MPAEFGRPQMPMQVPLDQQNFNQWVFTTLSELKAALVPPSVVSNFRVTPQPGGNLIDFTRTDGDSYTLYINTTPSIDLATLVRLGNANRYTHSVGIGAVTYYYAVKTNKGAVSSEVGPWVAGTTLGLAVPAASVDPPPATEFPFVDNETDAVAVQVPSGIDFQPV